jgi:hypothetical protein
MIHVSIHACERFIERCHRCSIEEAKEEILSHTRAIEAAARFHCEVVRLGDGSRLILKGERVITVYPAGEFPRQCRNPYTQEAA